MRNSNSLSKVFYILENLLWGFICVRIYTAFCFVNLPGLDFKTSKWILYIMTAVFVAAGILLTIRHRRNIVSTLINAALPLALYTFIAYFRYLKVFFSILLVLSIIGSIVYILIIYSRSKNDPDRTQKKSERSVSALLGIRTISTAVCFIAVLYLVFTTLTGVYLYRPDAKAVSTDVSFEEYFSDNKDTFTLLNEDNWKDLENRKKLDVLQTVCNAETIRLGLSDPVYIRSRLFEDDLLGKYNNADRTVLINTKFLEDGTSRKVLECTLHECYHSYQYSLIELYDSAGDDQKNLRVFNSVRKYRAELADYNDGQSPGEYYNQEIESDSRDYAQYAVNVYFEHINRYLDENTKEIKETE